MTSCPFLEPTEESLRPAYLLLRQKWERELDAVAALRRVPLFPPTEYRSERERDVAFAEDETARAVALYFNELRDYLRNQEAA